MYFYNLYNTIREALMVVLLEAMFEKDFEDELDTAEQLVTRGIKLIVSVDWRFWRQWYRDSPDPWYHQLADSLAVPADYVHLAQMIRDEVLREGSHAIMHSHMSPRHLVWGERYNQGMGWYRSREGVGNMPIVGYIADKNKWSLNEVFSFCISIKNYSPSKLVIQSFVHIISYPIISYHMQICCQLCSSFRTYQSICYIFNR